MNKLKALHVASFQGNIGDNANHTGFRKQFQKNTGIELVYTEFEIRKVFWKQTAFDAQFVELANDFDLIIIGGGNYFELWVEDSATGTSFDMSLELFEKIKPPVIFNALGVDPAQGAKETSVNKFRNFLDLAHAKGNVLLSCRNDGSLETLKTIIGEKYAAMFHHVPDAGFFTETIDYPHPEIDPTKKNIVLQLAGDMLDTRFSLTANDSISYAQFIESMAEFICELYRKENVNLILAPHIFRDLDIIHSLLNVLPDSIRRGSLSVAPYLVGQKGQDYIFDIYKKADLVLGMRFHANVCALGLGTPVIGLVNYRQIEKLFDEMGLNAFKVDVNKQGFDQKLLALSRSLLKAPESFPKGYLNQWQKKLNTFHTQIAQYLSTI
jgi:polysaccharide pyruvyl transferase WcaK-like protein